MRRSPQRLLSLVVFALATLAPAPLAWSAPTEAQLAEVAHSRTWQVLLHYRSGLLRGPHSEADGPDFFFSPRGKVDPLAELTASLRAFADPKPIRMREREEPAQCFFPARWRYLRENLPLDIPAVACPKFVDWKAKFKHPRSVTVVYAAAYLGSPASMFGHSFLRVDSASSAQGALLDQAISFEAYTETDGGIGYIMNGLIGNYPGVFSRHPFHLKTHLYSNLESRDLWEYRLALSPAEIDRLLDHAWEMGTTWFNYFFFDENCSYHLLSLIEAAHPEWRLRDRFMFSAVPSDTIRALADLGAVAEIQLRPSLLRTLGLRLKAMSKAERDRFYALRDTPSLARELRADESAPVLDALLDWRKYRAVAESRTLLDLDHQVELALLSARARNPHPPTDPGSGWNPVDSESLTAPPEVGHATTKVSFRAGGDRGRGATGNFVGLEFRPAVHDFLDPDRGYLPWSELVVGRTAIEYRVDEPRKLRLEELTFGKVSSMSPWSRFERPLSWTIGVGLYRPYATGCTGCLALRARGGFGVSSYLLPETQNVLVFGLLRANLETAPSFRPWIKPGPSFELGTYFRVTPRTKIGLSAEQFVFLQAPSESNRSFLEARGELAHTFRSWDIRVLADRIAGAAERPQSRLTLQVGVYY